VLVPAGMLAFVQPIRRRILGALSLVATVGLSFVSLGGPDSPLLVLGIIPLSVTLGAIAVELGGLILALARRWRRRDAH
jgi:hypothetical protein